MKQKRDERIKIVKKVNKLKRFITRNSGNSGFQWSTYEELEDIKHQIMLDKRLKTSIFKRVNEISREFKEWKCKQEEMSSQDYEEMYNEFPNDY